MGIARRRTHRVTKSPLDNREETCGPPSTSVACMPPGARLVADMNCRRSGNITGMARAIRRRAGGGHVDQATIGLLLPACENEAKGKSPTGNAALAQLMPTLAAPPVLVKHRGGHHGSSLESEYTADHARRPASPGDCSADGRMMSATRHHLGCLGCYCRSGREGQEQRNASPTEHRDTRLQVRSSAGQTDSGIQRQLALGAGRGRDSTKFA